MKVDPNTIHPIPGYNKEIYIKPTIKNKNILVMIYLLATNLLKFMATIYQVAREKASTPFADGASARKFANC